jgi:hypothetical protein
MNLQRLGDRLGDRKLRSLTRQDGVAYKGWLKGEARTKPTRARSREDAL